MLSCQSGNFRKNIRVFALALANTSAQGPSQDLLVGRCSNIHIDQFTRKDAADASRARKYFRRGRLEISSIANTKGQALIAWPPECTLVKLQREKLSMHLLQLLRGNLASRCLRILVLQLRIDLLRLPWIGLFIYAGQLQIRLPGWHRSRGMRDQVLQ